MPGSGLQAKVVQAPTGFHHGIPEPVLQGADGILDDPVPFHSTDGVFNADADGGNTTIHGFLRGCQFSSRGCFLGLDNRDVLPVDALAALILVPTATRWHGRGSQLCQAFIRRVAFTGMTQEAHVTGLVNHEEVFERVTRLLAAVIFLWLFGSSRAVDRTFSPIRPNRGGGDLPSAVRALHIAAHSAAVRAGSTSWSANA